MTLTLLDTSENSPRPLFDRTAFAALIRATHPERRFAITASTLAVSTLDHQPDTADAWIYGAYATVLGRLPDNSRLAVLRATLRHGGSPAELVEGLASTIEARDTNVVASADLDDVFVTGAYLVALGRRPDPAGADVQLAALRAGEDHSTLLQSLVDSPEAQSQLRFPPAPVSPADHLARAVQAVVPGVVDPGLHRELVAAVNDGRSVTWMVRTTLRLRGGRLAMLRSMPRWLWLGSRAERHASATALAAAEEASTAWNWRVQRALFNDVARLTEQVAVLRSQLRQR